MLSAADAPETLRKVDGLRSSRSARCNWARPLGVRPITVSFRFAKTGGGREERDYVGDPIVANAIVVRSRKRPLSYISGSSNGLQTTDEASFGFLAPGMDEENRGCP